MDYYSRFVEVQKLTSTTSMSVITALKSMFFQPFTFMSDNGPQFVSEEMKEFRQSYFSVHVTSSLHYPQSNGLVERTVKTVKVYWKIHTTFSFDLQGNSGNSWTQPS